jgi:tRNA/tmRNA/rRNA uracil-C5-methylase (TrmA/RlmC/RlmD family)
MPAAIRRVTIETLAPTGEGVARAPEGVGFVAGTLPGEEVDAEVLEERRRFWKGRVAAIRVASPDRLTGRHAEGCAGCDWAHLPLYRAREWKRRLFLETMHRIGELPPELFGELPIAPSPEGYRLRARFHGRGRGESAAIGFFAPRSHDLQPAEGCLALGERLRALLPELEAAVARSGAEVEEISTAETPDQGTRLARVRLSPGSGRVEAAALVEALASRLDGIAVEDASGSVVARMGAARLWIAVGGREFPVTASTFFQSNRYLLDALYADALGAARIPAGTALDAFGGVGLFAGALLDAGHAVTSVEGEQAAVDLANEAKKRWGASGWTITRSAVLSFLERTDETFDAAVADPPRAGLGLRLSGALGKRVRGRLHYVSCDPATLARDLAVLVGSGLAIRDARLYDLFAWTHRVEAAVTLEPAAG